MLLLAKRARLLYHTLDSDKRMQGVRGSMLLMPHIYLQFSSARTPVPIIDFSSKVCFTAPQPAAKPTGEFSAVISTLFVSLKSAPRADFIVAA